MRAFIGLFLRSPLEALIRVVEFLEVFVEQTRAPVELPVEPQPLNTALRALEARSGLSLLTRLDEGPLKERLRSIQEVAWELPGEGAIIGAFHKAGDVELARACYALCRALVPDTVVETGVSYGLTTGTLLMALEQNGGGVLHSVDRPPLSAPDRDWVGSLVPEHLKHCWSLHVGSTRTLLPGVLQSAEGMRLFVHDSLHTHRNMTFELEHARRWLATPGVIIVDDVDDNHAFRDWVAASTPTFWTVIEQEHKESYFGLAYFDGS